MKINATPVSASALTYANFSGKASKLALIFVCIQTGDMLRMSLHINFLNLCWRYLCTNGDGCLR